MINIIRSINYSTRKNLAVFIAIIAMIGLPVLMAGMVLGTSLTDMDGAEYYIKAISEAFFIVVFASLTLSCIPSYGDAGDRTLNYEIMAGHGRSRIFLARMISGLFWGVIILAVLYYYPFVLFGCIGGWYKGVSIQDVACRVLLSLLPMFRISAFAIMMSSLFRSAGKGIGFSFLAFELGSILNEVIVGLMNLKDHEMPWFMGMLNITELHHLSNCREYVVSGEKVTVYETAIPPYLLWSTVIASLVFGIIYLTVAYIDFKKRDRD